MNIIESLNCPNIHMGTFNEIKGGNYNFKDFTVILVGNKKMDDMKKSDDSDDGDDSDDRDDNSSDSDMNSDYDFGDDDEEDF